MLFKDLDLSDAILKAVSEKGYTTPSPIQEKAIPPILEGRDVLAAAQTGTGKTAGFTLPMLERLAKGQRAGPNQARALVLTPTRELAAQVRESVIAYSEHLALTSAVVYGGVSINPQMMRLRRGTDILVATPGRLLDLYNQRAIKFKNLEILVLDEADRMLDMGFIHDIKKIIKALPKERQNLMFSATFSDDIRNLAKTIVRNPVEISVSPRNSTATSVTQSLIAVDKKQKSALLTHLIATNRWEQVLVFTKTKRGANKLAGYLDEYGIKADAIHGNKSQNARLKALAKFKAGESRVLVATDIAARGLDIDQLPHVINFDLPSVAEDYVHRIGRTGRAGAEGEALSLVSADEFKQLSDIEKLIKREIKREMIAGFEPTQVLPASGTKPKKVPGNKPQSQRRYSNKNRNQNDGNKPAGARKRKPKPGGNGGGRSRTTSTKKRPTQNK